MQKIIFFIFALSGLGCSNGSSSGGDSAANNCDRLNPDSYEYFMADCDFNETTDQQSEDEDDDRFARPENCRPVDGTELFDKIHGSWEYHRVSGTRSPMCRSVDEGSAFTYVSFDARDQSFSQHERVYTSGYRGILACQQSAFNSGGRKNILEEFPVTVCQTDTLIERLGSKAYFIYGNGFYRIVSHTEDTLGRTILLYSHRIANHPGVGDDDLNIHTYINHRNYRTVRMD